MKLPSCRILTPPLRPPHAISFSAVWYPVFDCIEAYAPGFKRSVVGRDILTPPDLERIFGLPGGVSIRLGVLHHILLPAPPPLACPLGFPLSLHTQPVLGREDGAETTAEGDREMVHPRECGEVRRSDRRDGAC